MDVTCSVSGCIHNDGNGGCECGYIVLSDAYDGQPICETAEFNEDDYDEC